MMEPGRMTVLIMAAGTGGHVFPALSIAEALRNRSIYVEWLGTPQGMENRLLAKTDIRLHQVSVQGLRGAGISRLLRAPLDLLKAFFASLKVIRQVQPSCVIGMGGFVCGPAGLACRFRGIPLLLHEQNAVAGLTNRLLAPLATNVLESFPGTFRSKSKVRLTGNPLRKSVLRHAVAKPRQDASEALRLLILGGSQGAQVINRVLPGMIADFTGSAGLLTYHQTGIAGLEQAVADYGEAGIDIDDSHRVVGFVEDMSAAYAWADLVLCRSGASTVFEIAAAGLPAIFVPYPYHKDQQQLLNARWLSESGAAVIIRQEELEVATLLKLLHNLDADRETLGQMAVKASSKAILDADQRIVDVCLEVLHG